jgi:hypothetical protein
MEFDDLAALSRFFADPSYAEAKANYEQAAGEPASARFDVGQFTIGHKLEMFEKGGPDALKLFAFLPRGDHLSREQFLHDWHTFASAYFVTNEAIVRELLGYYQVHALLDGPAAKGFDGTIILRFAEPAAVPRFSEAEKTRAASPEFFSMEKAVVLLTTEAPL